MLDWSISGTNTSSGPSYKISSSDNPFTLPFVDANLTLRSKNQPDEHYAFTTVIEKIVIPDGAISSDGAAARCYYNNSMISAKLYTKMQTMLPNNETVSAAQKPEGSWPGAVEIWQTSPDPPVCYKAVGGGPDGEQVQLQGAVTESECKCEYADFEGDG